MGLALINVQLESRFGFNFGQISICGFYSRIVTCWFLHIILINFLDAEYVQNENLDVPKFYNIHLDKQWSDVNTKNINFTPVNTTSTGWNIGVSYTKYKNNEVPIIEDSISKFSNTVRHPRLGRWENFGESSINLPRNKGIGIPSVFGLGVGGGVIAVGILALRKCCKKKDNIDDNNSTNDNFQEDAVVIELPENMENGTDSELGAETD